MAYRYINEDAIDAVLVPFIEYLNREGGEEVGKDHHYFSNAERAVKLLKEEKYKADFYDIAFGKIDSLDEDPESVGKGDYSSLVKELVTDSRHNLVFRFQKTKFADQVKASPEKYDQLFYDLLKTQNDELTFQHMTKQFGATYDLIAFLFSLKGEPYLPISGTLEDGFKQLSIDMPLKGKCSWENYNRYCDTVQELHAYIQATYDESATLYHAHSFLWLISNNAATIFDEDIPDDQIEEKAKEYAKDNKDTIEEKADNELNARVQKAAREGKSFSDTPKEKGRPERRSGNRVFPRNPQIATNALAYANYECECDRSHQTFFKKSNGHPYTEPHHLIPMSFSDDFKYSLDCEANIVSLCSNCHNWIHYGRGAKELLEKLYDERRDRLEQAGIGITKEQLFKMYDL